MKKLHHQNTPDRKPWMDYSNLDFSRLPNGKRRSNNCKGKKPRVCTVCGERVMGKDNEKYCGPRCQGLGE